MPKERILPYVILGIVRTHQSLTGKAISQQFETEIGEFWKASHSQIYPELKRMITDKWLEQTTDPNNLKEKYYPLTPLGEETLSAWLLAPVLEAPTQKDLFSLKMFFIRSADDSRVRSLLEEEKELLDKQLAHLNKRLELLFPSQEEITQQYGHYLILSRAIARVRSQLDWIEDTLAHLA